MGGLLSPEANGPFCTNPCRTPFSASSHRTRRRPPYPAARSAARPGTATRSSWGNGGTPSVAKRYTGALAAPALCFLHRSSRCPLLSLLCIKSLPASPSRQRGEERMLGIACTSPRLLALLAVERCILAFSSAVSGPWSPASCLLWAAASISL